MGWSLTYLQPQEPELLDRFFLALGRALYLASVFEGKCRFVLRIATLVEHYEQNGDGSGTLALAQSLKDKMLGQTIAGLRSFSEITLEDITLIEKAKDARNFIAHEAANIGYLSSLSGEQIHKQLGRLRREVGLLIAGDNLVSRWVYEIEEKEPAPSQIQKAYPQWVDEWVFSNIDRT